MNINKKYWGMAMNDFERVGYVVIRGALTEQTTKLLQYNFNMIKDVDLFSKGMDPNATFFGDNQVKNSFYWYGAYCFESLMLVLQPTVEEVIGKELYPCYTYARIMRTGADMPKHKDRPSCQYSATICISEDADSPYPIFMENYQGEASAVHLAPGDMIVYNGTELNHWREEYKGKEQMQAFIHFVDANGEYKDYKFDKRPMLGLSAATKQQ
jgi:hypothetical protein